jgi:hypothetical protein
VAFHHLQARSSRQRSTFQCSGAQRAHTASLSERVSAKLGEQELRLEVAAYRRNETTVRVPNRVGMTAGFGRAATMSCRRTASGCQVWFRSADSKRPTQVAVRSGRSRGSSAKAAISLCGGWVICPKCVPDEQPARGRLVRPSVLAPATVARSHLPATYRQRRWSA